jgi:hypothetical protein
MNVAVDQPRCQHRDLSGRYRRRGHRPYLSVGTHSADQLTLNQDRAIVDHLAGPTGDHPLGMQQCLASLDHWSRSAHPAMFARVWDPSARECPAEDSLY